VSFLEGEPPNVLDETLNWLFLGSMLTGLLGSVAAWLNKNKKKKRDDLDDDEVAAAP